VAQGRPAASAQPGAYGRLSAGVPGLVCRDLYSPHRGLGSYHWLAGAREGGTGEKGDAVTNATKTLTDLVDPDEVAKFAFRVWGYKQGEMVSLLIHLGDRLGVYRVLDGAGMVTADDLARRTGLHPRWLLEWLRGNAAADLLASEDGERFELTAVGAMVLTREEDSLRFAAGAFGPPPEPALVDELAEAFRTGAGLPYDRQGPAGVHVTERMLGPWARLSLVPTIVPALEGVHDRLAAGALVADVGCGAGVALTALAKTYPRSTFHGYELSRLAVERARARVAEVGLTNVEIINRRAEDLPDRGDYSLVLTFDCLHDMTRPDAAAAAIRRAIADDGTWLVKEIRCDNTWVGNRRNPMLAMFLGFSIASCMSSALSEPGGAGLGTIGLPPQALEQLARNAGFTRFLVHDFEDPANLYYEVRP
jgi:2-polyprenyl-3-methyl-5-hydroxy-6-metoxy-1,4-benzoquinol methylase